MVAPARRVSQLKRLLLLCLLTACSPPPPRDPPSVGGLRPGMTLAQAIELLPPAEPAPPDKEGRVFQLQDTRVTTEVGSIVRMRGAKRLNYGNYDVKVGATTKEAEQLLGPAPSTFPRGEDVVKVWELKEYRYDLTFNNDKLREVELSIRPRPVLRDSAEYGVGTRGDTLNQRLQLAIDGISLGMKEPDVEKLSGKPDPRVTGSSRAYNALATMVDYDDNGSARWVLGRKLLRDGADWVTVGAPAKDVQKKLATVARLHTQSASVVSYTFLQFGEVRMYVQPDQTVGALELVAP